jgi:uncharacterized protein with PIN domain
MDSAESTPSIEQIANLVVEKLTQGGKLADLANADLMTIEEETVDQVDQVTRAVMNQLLGQHAEAAPPPTVCPRCGGPLCEKPPQGRSMQSKRGRVHFKTDVFRCEACRLDFFPSDENTSL